MTKKPPFLALPHHIIETVLPFISGNGFKVWHYVYRMTEGFGGRAWKVTYEDILENTGIGSKSTIKKCLDEIQDYGFQKNDDGLWQYRNCTKVDASDSTETVPATVQKLYHDSTETVPKIGVLKKKKENIKESSNDPTPIDPESQAIFAVIDYWYKISKRKVPQNHMEREMESVIHLLNEVSWNTDKANALLLEYRKKAKVERNFSAWYPSQIIPNILDGVGDGASSDALNAWQTALSCATDANRLPDELKAVVRPIWPDIKAVNMGTVRNGQVNEIRSKFVELYNKELGR